MFETTREFVRALEERGELRRVRARVSPVLEIAAIADRMSKSRAPNMPSASARRNDPRFHHLGGSALLFENVEGSDFPVLINAWGSYSRMELALGCGGENEKRKAISENGSRGGARGEEGVDGFEMLAQRIAELVKPEPPRSLAEAFAKAKQFAPLLRIPPKRLRGSGLCQEVVITGEKVDLTRLPLIRCWPLDGDLAAVGYPPDVNDGVPGVERGAEWDRHFRGRYITLGGVHTIHADDEGNPKPSSHNIGMYRVQLFGKRTMAMHWHVHHDGARHWRSWKAKGKAMPVAIALGGESVMPYAATAPLPPGISELLLAGFLNGRGIPMVRAKTVPLWVPANAEMVIEGWVSAEAGGIGWTPGRDYQSEKRKVKSENEEEGDRRRATGDRKSGEEDAIGRRHRGILASRHQGEEASRHRGDELGPGAVFEGPFGDHTGFYSMPDRYPVLEVSAITHRRGAIYPTTIVGLPPQEDYYLGKATERVFLPLLKTILPDIEDYDLPMFGAFHNAAFIKIKKQYPLHARRVMHGVWGAGQMSWTKTVVVVDEDVDVHDTMAVLRAVGERCVPARDAEMARGPLDILDHASPYLGAGGKMGLDATRKVGEAETHRVMSELAAELCKAGEIRAVTGEGARAFEARARQIPGVLDASIPEELGGWWLLVRATKEKPVDGVRIIKALGGMAEDGTLPRWTIVVGPEADLADVDGALFHWMANSAPDRDRHVSLCGRRVAFDATPKGPGDEANGLPVRAWPPIIRMSREMVERIEQRWGDLGFGAQIAPA